MASHSGIAIVGIALRLPSGEYADVDLDYEHFWNFLIEGGFSGQPLASVGLRSKEAHIALPEKGSFFKDTEKFDHVSFGVGIKDARAMPFAHRRLMEVSFEALLDSGINYRGKSVGSFMSGSIDSIEGMDTEGSVAYVQSQMAARISYALNLTGPSMTVDSACSSSLTGVHLACRAIKAGDCDAAVVGACQSNRGLPEWQNYVQAKVLSSDGMSKTFDAAADGFGRGEGAVAIVLKAETQATRDGDRIYGVIKGTAVNHTGSSSPLLVPSGSTQVGCIQRAYESAGLNFADVDFIELHATGTSVGDPIETNAVVSLLSPYEGTEYIAGSVKPNIGHLECCAFLASLAKACLILEHKAIPPNIHLSQRNPSIHWDNIRLTVPTAVHPLGCKSASGRSIISISSAGIGGSTGHVVLQGPPARPPATQSISTRPSLLLFAGFSPSAIEHISKLTLEHCSREPEGIASASATLSRRARQFLFRSYNVYPSPTASTVYAQPPTRVPTEPPSIVFVFSGQGPHHIEMGRQLFVHFPVFRDTILELDDVYRQICGHSLIEATGLFGEPKGTPPVILGKHGWPVAITCPALAMLHIALYDLLRAAGVRADAFMGHSAGETPLLYASGAGSKAMALEIAIARGRAMTATEDLEAGMAALACSSDRATEIISRFKDDPKGHLLSIACHNAPESVTVSGPNDLLDRVVKAAKEEHLFAQRIRTFVPGHSSYMHVCEEVHNSLMSDVFARYPGEHIPVTPVFSTSSKQETVAHFDSAYYWGNCRNPVTFDSAISSIMSSPLGRPSTVFLEVSPHAVLSASIQACGVSPTQILCPSKRFSSSQASQESLVFLDCLGRLSLLGVNDIDLSPLMGSPDASSRPYLQYPLNPITIPLPDVYHLHDGATSNLIPSGVNMSPVFRHPRSTFKDLTQHVIKGESIFPMTGYIELLLELGATCIWDVDLISILPLPSDGNLDIYIEREAHKWSIFTETVDGRRRIHAQGCMDSASNPAPSIEQSELPSTGVLLQAKDLYEDIASVAEFGPLFRRAARTHIEDTELYAEITAFGAAETPEQYVFHPALLDACLHAALHPLYTQSRDEGIFFIPSHFRSFTLYRPPSRRANLISALSLKEWSPGRRVYDVLIKDDSGEALCCFRGLTLDRQGSKDVPALAHYDLIHQPVAITAPFPDVPRHLDGKQRDRDRLCRTLDIMAARIATGSDDIAIPEALPASTWDLLRCIDRHRYHSFKRSAHVRDAASMAQHDEDIAFVKEQLPAHFEMTERLARIQEAIALSPTAVIEALFRDDLMDRFYTKEAFAHSACSSAKAVFCNVIAAIREGGKRHLRVLELGSGTGSLTRHLIDGLRNSDLPDVTVEYVVTDVSRSLATHLVQTLDYPNATAAVYDISKGPEEQGLSRASIDVIVAHEVLHTSPDLHECMANVQSLLVPGGFLLAIELDGTAWRQNTLGSIWHDWVFGSFSEWFGQQDGRTHPSMTDKEWTALLNDTGFSCMVVSREDGGGLNMLMVSQKQQAANYLMSTQEPQELSSTISVVPYRKGEEIALQTFLGSMDTLQPHTILLVGRPGSDADAGYGIVATLNHEYPTRDIRLIVSDLPVKTFCHPSTSLLALLKTEHIIHFHTNGDVWVPRLSPVRPRPSSASMIMSSLPAHDLPDGHVGIEIIEHTQSSGFLSFFGRVTASRSYHAPTGYFAIGVTASPHSTSTVVVHTSRILCSRDGDFLRKCDPLVAVACFFLREEPYPRAFRRPSSVLHLLALSDDKISQAVQSHLAASSPPSSFSTEEVGPVDIVFTDSLMMRRSPHLQRMLTRTGRIILWDSQLRSMLHDESSDFAQIFASILAEVPESREVESSESSPLEAKQTSSHILDVDLLLRNDRTYLLAGGATSVGIHLAIWMYERGARHIVLSSRRGLSANHTWDDTTNLKFAYLLALPDIRVRVESCDASDVGAMTSLFESLEFPLGGCLILTLVLSDAIFSKQSADNFSKVRQSKQGVFDALSNAIDVNMLEFVVHVSSMSGLLGMPGQSPYASACSELDEMLRNYKNAFAFVCPALYDVGYVSRLDMNGRSRRDLESFAISIDALCASLEEGIRQLKHGAVFSRYIPHTDAILPSLLSRCPPSHCRHLFRTRQAAVARPQNPEHAVTDSISIALEILAIPLSNFDPQRPLVEYGLDSIGAARLATALRPYLKTSQIQILSGATWDDLSKLTRISALGEKTSGLVKSSFATGEAVLEIVLGNLGISRGDLSYDQPLLAYGMDSIGAAKLSKELRPYAVVTQIQLLAGMTFRDLIGSSGAPAAALRSTEIEQDVIVQLFPGSGTPLVLLHDITGSITTYLRLRPYVRSPIWAVQATQSAPMDDLASLASFYFDKLKEVLPQGPIRLAAFSASSILAAALAKLFEEDGVEILGLTFVDHFPAFWAALASLADAKEVLKGDIEPVRRAVMNSLVDMLERDGKTGVAQAQEFAAARQGHAASSNTINMLYFIEAMMKINTEFVLKTAGGTFDDAASMVMEWMRTLRAPISLVLATAGVRTTVPPHMREAWSNLGIEYARQNVIVHRVETTHFRILGDATAAAVMQGVEVETVV